MRRQVTTAVITLSLVSGFSLVGCDQTVSEKTTETTSSDGSKQVDKTKTTQSPDGSVHTQTEHSTENNSNK
jgi:hypothetical protein